MARSTGVLAMSGLAVFAAGVGVGAWWAGSGEPGNKDHSGALSTSDSGGSTASPDGPGADTRVTNHTRPLPEGGGVGPGSAGRSYLQPSWSETSAETASPPKSGVVEGSTATEPRIITSEDSPPVGGTPVGGNTGAGPSTRAAGGLLDPGTLPPRAEPPGPYELPETLEGRLISDLTGEPVKGATLELHFETSDGTRGSGIRITVGEDGSFSYRPAESMRKIAESYLMQGVWKKYDSVDAFLDDTVFTLIGRAEGHEDVRRGHPPARVILRLKQRFEGLATGRLRVDARWPDDVRYAGRLLVNLWGRGQDYSQWALADPDGTYLLTGILPGKYNARIAGRGDSGKNVVIPEAGEARVRLAVHRDGVHEQADDLPQGPLREVHVSTGGREQGLVAYLRAEADEDLFWRSEVVASTAVFPALPAGRWTFALQTPGKEPLRTRLTVPEGSGRVYLQWEDQPEPDHWWYDEVEEAPEED